MSDVPATDLCNAAVSPLFDHLGGAGEQCWWHGEAERLRGLRGDGKLVLCRRLHPQLRRLLALEDASDVAGAAAVLVDVVRPIRAQAPAREPEACMAARW